LGGATLQEEEKEVTHVYTKQEQHNTTHDTTTHTHELRTSNGATTAPQEESISRGSFRDEVAVVGGGASQRATS